MFSLPLRSCIKKAGPFDVALINIIKIGNNQLKTHIITIRETVISIARFKKAFNTLFKDNSSSSGFSVLR